MKGKVSSRIVYFAIIMNAVIALLVFLFGLYLFLNPDGPIARDFINNIAKHVPVPFQGPEGVKGDKGDKGDDGIQGLQGVQGVQGAQGPTGATGPQGIQGPEGPQGTQGTQGPTGEQGPAGPQGEQGPQGVQGERADFRCNPDTHRREYKYPSDTEWTSTNEFCIAV